MADFVSSTEEDSDAFAMTSDRRLRERRPYEVMQQMAPCPDGKLPPLTSFRPVRCHDLSSSGVSFDTTTPPLDEFVALALGGGKDVVYLRARVANSFRVNAGGGAVFRIGCEFLNRLNPADK